MKGEGMGIEFTAMQPEARGRLNQLLRRLLRHSADAEPTEAAQTPQL
jgi:hypothetical protein